MEFNNHITITLTINGEQQQVSVPPMARLLDIIRNKLELTGTKEGCGAGECGACAVLLDGKMVNSCLIPAIQANGSSVYTIEGLAQKEEFNCLEHSFHKKGGTQCGFCTPGMLIASYQLIKDKSSPNREEIRQAMAGNLCRCTGHQKIIDSVADAIEQLTKSPEGQ
ncbi:MAG: (2Fe-2S)-binding protein [Bdellovibrionales bacterium]|jgi:aerobic carbon-monoxide dehydrogenase small subunit|nr:(2Fe-2S)-binding protein [Bdellovibrionales bacterium]MBT3525737.1 (2Fe-2S)-binding protein [Bdellovibrionales bacterium]MBT7765800.1 (2Fe-2S)-binding protein [Bdellovibrionales bacterium]